VKAYNENEKGVKSMLGERDAISELRIIQKKYWIKLFDENEKKNETKS
jgi:hypothetical protein